MTVAEARRVIDALFAEAITPGAGRCMTFEEAHKSVLDEHDETFRELAKDGGDRK